MPKSTTFDNDLLKLIFQATAISLLADNAGTTPLTQLFVALHVGALAVGDTQNANEAAYTNYGRIGVNRNATGWTVASNNCTNNAAINFNACGATGNNVTWVSVGSNVSGSTKVFYAGALNATLQISNGVTPSFAAGNLTVSEA